MIVGLGQAAAGDDGVGLAVARALRAKGVEAVELSDASGLIDLLTGGRVVLVDAVVDAGPPGTLLEVERDRIASVQACSTHALDVPTVIGLAEALNGPEAAAGLVLLGVAIAPPGLGFGLSEAVAAAVPAAAARAMELSRNRRFRPATSKSQISTSSLEG